jgi:hypothetical protein
MAFNLQAVKKLSQPTSCCFYLHFSPPFAEHLQDPLGGHLLANILGSLLHTLISLECDQSLPSEGTVPHDLRLLTMVPHSLLNNNCPLECKENSA